MTNVACLYGPGIILAGIDGHSYLLKGPSTAIPTAVWNAWLATYAASSLVLNRIVYAS